MAMCMTAEPAPLKSINLMGPDLVTARLYFALSGLWGEIDVALMYHTGVGLSSMNPCASEVPIYASAPDGAAVHRLVIRSLSPVPPGGGRSGGEEGHGAPPPLASSQI